MSLKEYLLSDTSPAAPGTVVSSAVTGGLSQFDWFTLDALLTQATGGTLDVYLQRFVATLNEWRDWVHFTQLAAGSASFRYTLDSRMASTSIVAVGQGSSPAIAAGTIVCAHPGDKVRLAFTAGASTSAGAGQKVVLSGWRRR